MDDCKGSISLDFSYTADGNTQVFNEYIKTVELYVFDDGGRQVQTRRLEGGELQDRRAVLDLTPGHYRIIAVGNLGEKDCVDGAGMLAQAVVTHRADTEDADGNPTGDDPLYMADVEAEVAAAGDVSRTMDFHNCHIRMVVEVQGAARDEEQATEAVPAWTQLGIRWTALPSRTTLDGASVQGPLCDYEPVQGHYDEITRKLTSTINVMRFDQTQQTMQADGTRIELVVTNLITGTPIETVDVMEFVADNHIDLNREEVAIGVLIVISKDGDITVEVPDWVIEEVKPGL